MDMILYQKPTDLGIVPLIFPGWITEMWVSGPFFLLSNWTGISPEMYKPMTIHSLFIIITIEHLSNVSVE